MALNVETLSAMLRSALIRTVHYTMGIAWKVVIELHQLYQPNDAMSEIFMLSRFDEIVWNPTDNPDDFDAKLIAIHCECTDLPVDRTELSVLLKKAPDIYRTAIAMNIRRLAESGRQMDYAYVLDVCRDVYRQTWGLQNLKSKKNKEQKEKEVQLANANKNNKNNNNNNNNNNKDNKNKGG